MHIRGFLLLFQSKNILKREIEYGMIKNKPILKYIAHAKFISLSGSLHRFFTHKNVRNCDQKFQNSRKISVYNSFYAPIIKYILKNGS